MEPPPPRDRGPHEALPWPSREPCFGLRVGLVGKAWSTLARCDLMRKLAILSSILLVATPSLAETLDNWPCPGCFTQVPAKGAESPRPLLLVLHGDGGGIGKVLRAWRRAADEAGVLLLAPRCPVALGCTTGSYWQWFESLRHDRGWLDAQIEAVTKRFPVDPARVYATGFSGGATYLGWYVPDHPRRFAAVAFVSGGAGYRGPCSDCKLPVNFVIGSVDPMIVPYTAPLRSYFETCGGHEVRWEELRGVTHEGMLPILAAGKAKEILDWLLARPASCSASSSIAAVTDAGDSDAPPSPPLPASDSPDVASSPAPDPTWAPPRTPPGSGCGCHSATRQAGSACLPALGAVLGLRWSRRSRRKGPSPRPFERV